jgi:hypothetical protein
LPALSVVLPAIILGLTAGCGNISAKQLGLSNKSSDLSGAGVTPHPSWHTSYLSGTHAGYVCSDCHVSVARVKAARSTFREISGDQICARCHTDAYNRTNFFNHPSLNAGTRCNTCHYSDSFTSHTRISHRAYHNSITGSCISCHTGKTPANHKKDGRTANCESCHKYPDWRNASFNHSGVSGGCASCHSGHKAGYACESCHTFGISWGYSHSRVRNDGCPVCHGSGGGENDGDNKGGKDYH